METLSELILKHKQITPTPGEKEGICCLCGRETNKGFKKKFGNNFTSYNLLQHGNIICEYCYPISQDRQSYRRSMWIVSDERGFETFKKDKGKNVLLNPPDPPFAMYFTRTWKKQGWISLMNKVNNNKELFWVGFDYDTILINIESVREDFDIIKELRELKINKEEIRTGRFSSKTLMKILDYEEILQSVLERKGSLLWDLEVFLNE